MFKIKRTEPAPGVIFLQFENQYETCSTFMRLQEFYESPIKGIRGQVFSLEKFMDLYAKTQGNFTYTTDWGGFNVPGHIVDRFFEMYEGDLLEKEITLRDAIQAPEGPYYVIAMYGYDALEHELAHALFYLNPEYRKYVKKMVKALPKSTHKTIETWLLNKGYSKPQVIDEINAYLATSSKEELIQRFGKKVGSSYDKLSHFRSTFNNYVHLED